MSLVQLSQPGATVTIKLPDSNMSDSISTFSGVSSSSDGSSCGGRPYCWRCHVDIDTFNQHPYFVDCTGFQLCTRCYGDRNYDKLDLLHDDYAPGQVRRWDDYSDHTVALKPVVCVPGEEDGDEHEPWTVEDWVPIRPRKRPRKEKTYPFVPMFELEKDRHNRLRFSITFHQKHYMLVH